MQGETTELCKWTVDLTTLPSFRQNANIPQPNGFYTGEYAPHGAVFGIEGSDVLMWSISEFELGLEMDSAEVRGVLFYEGQEWSRVVFDFLN